MYIHACIYKLQASPGSDMFSLILKRTGICPVCIEVKMNTIHVHHVLQKLFTCILQNPPDVYTVSLDSMQATPFMCASVGDYVTMSQLWHISLSFQQNINTTAWYANSTCVF